MNKKTEIYDENNIDVLKGLEAVRIDQNSYDKDKKNICEGFPYQSVHFF